MFLTPEPDALIYTCCNDSSRPGPYWVVLVPLKKNSVRVTEFFGIGVSHRSTQSPARGSVTASLNRVCAGLARRTRISCQNLPPKPVSLVFCNRTARTRGEACPRKYECPATPGDTPTRSDRGGCRPGLDCQHLGEHIFLFLALGLVPAKYVLAAVSSFRNKRSIPTLSPGRTLFLSRSAR